MLARKESATTLLSYRPISDLGLVHPLGMWWRVFDDKHCSPSVTHDAVTTFEVGDDRIGTGLDWTREQRKLDQDQDQEGDRAQRRDTFVTGDRDREGESGSPSSTSSNSLVNNTNRSPASNGGGDDDV